VCSKLPVFVRRQRAPTEHEASEKHDDQCWKNSSDSPSIEISVAEAVFFEITENDAADQIPRYDEEYIYANEPPWNNRRKCMEGNHHQNRDRSQAGDVGPIFGMNRSQIAVVLA
jgi:hypothetical protein